MQRFRLTGSLVANRRHRPHSRTRVMPVQVKDWHWVGMERHRGELGSGYRQDLFGSVTCSRANSCGSCRESGVVDFVCLARSLAYHHVLRMPREAGVIRLDIPVPGQAAAAQKNCESRYHGESVHVLCSFLAVPPGSIVQQ